MKQTTHLGWKIYKSASGSSGFGRSIRAKSPSGMIVMCDLEKHSEKQALAIVKARIEELAK